MPCSTLLNRLILTLIRKSGRCLKMENRGSQIPIKSRKIAEQQLKYFYTNKAITMEIKASRIEATPSRIEILVA